MFRTPQVILFSEDVPRAAAFYAGLGFTETFRVPAEGPPIHVDLTLDGYRIGIASVASTRDDHGLDPVDGRPGRQPGPARPAPAGRPVVSARPRVPPPAAGTGAARRLLPG
ncbi:hypothetical protein B0E53_04300 [Micromonospora sp. MH33]|uniref:VOC family protein n=1 Tax=Micromonospora sp. MH33 TaxID=1945509 RepID=UPI000D149427|nr:hypothetical protein B0E53_04300 [Micromonospora sp. MH33]